MHRHHIHMVIVAIHTMFGISATYQLAYVGLQHAHTHTHTHTHTHCTASGLRRSSPFLLHSSCKRCRLTRLCIHRRVLSLHQLLLYLGPCFTSWLCRRLVAAHPWVVLLQGLQHGWQTPRRVCSRHVCCGAVEKHLAVCCDTIPWMGSAAASMVGSERWKSAQECCREARAPPKPSVSGLSLALCLPAVVLLSLYSCWFVAQHSCTVRATGGALSTDM
jgi:hypothetical protein